MADWNEVPALVSGLREPAQLRRELTRLIQESYAALYKERGSVEVPEDTFAMQRRLGAAQDLFSGYAAAFGAAKKLIGQLQAEELVEAVGEQDEIPNQALTIPDPEGDLHVFPEYANAYEIDMDQILATLSTRMGALVEAAAYRWPGSTVLDPYDLATLIVNTVYETVTQWGKFEPRVSKVKAYGDSLARAGDDKGASVVRGAITRKRQYQGVKYERKAHQ